MLPQRRQQGAENRTKEERSSQSNQSTRAGPTPSSSKREPIVDIEESDRERQRATEKEREQKQGKVSRSSFLCFLSSLFQPLTFLSRLVFFFF